MIVNSQGNQTPYSLLGKIDDMFTGIKFPGGTQAMKTYLNINDVPHSLIEIKEQQGGNPFFIVDDAKILELSAFAKMNNLEVHYGVNAQDTIENQIVSIRHHVQNCPETVNLLLGSELYLAKWQRGEPTSSGVTVQFLLADYLLYLEKMITICKNNWPSLNITIPGASYQIDDDENPVDKRSADRRSWNSILKFWLELSGHFLDPKILTDYHLYIGAGLVDDAFDEEEVFQEVQVHYLDEVTTPIVTEMGTYIEGPHPQNIELYDKMLVGLGGDMKRFGIHVLYYKVANGYSKRFDRNFERYWFALFDPLGRTPKLEELRQWHNDKVEIEEPEPGVVVLAGYEVKKTTRSIRGKERQVITVRWFWSDETVWLVSGISIFMKDLQVPSDDDIGKPKTEFE